MSPTAMARDGAGAGRSATGRAPGATWILPLALLAACDGPSRGHVGEVMTAVGHERAAEVEERRALRAGQVTAAEVLRRAQALAAP